MAVPVAFLGKLWSFVTFLPFFFSLFVLGLLKAAIVSLVAVCIIGLVNSAVIIGLWIAHVAWTFYCVARTERLGLILKVLVLITLPAPLVLWPTVGIAGSLLDGVAYGVFAPLIGTFEAVGENVTDKFYHCFLLDGCKLQGIVASMSRLPTFRHRFRHSVKVFYIEAVHAGSSANCGGGILKAGYGRDSSAGTADGEEREAGSFSVPDGIVQ